MYPIHLTNSLELYLKFNEGFSNANNTGVTSILDDSNTPYSSIVPTSFAQTGTTSNWVIGPPLRIYVKFDAAGNSKGGTWENAIQDLSSALLSARAGQEIWVANGVYKPTVGSRNFSFVVKDSVKVYGGFEGIEPANYDLDLRILDLNKTILSGDIGVLADSSDNVYSVVRTTDVSAFTEIDGFTIQDGYADNPSASVLNSNTGGAWYNNATDNKISIPTIKNCTFQSNYARISGGAIYSSSTFGVAGLTLINCIFRGNESEAVGGAVTVNSIKQNDQLNMVNCAFVGNRASGFGSFGGALMITNTDGNNTANLTNCTFLSNLARFGGGVYLRESGGDLSINLSNSVLWANNAFARNAPDTRNGIEVDGATFTLSHSLLQDSLITTNGNISGDTDPLFLRSTDPFDSPNLETDFRLLPCSPLIDAGITQGSPSDDVYRRQRCNTPDIGAYEFKGSTSSPIIYVNENAGIGGSGTSWIDAFKDLHSAMLALGKCGADSIWVAKGTYYTTSGNDRDAAFNFIQNTTLRGGFTGTEPANYNLSLRDFEANETILSGDIGVKNDSLDNSHSLITVDKIAQTSEVDGFTLEKALADGSGTFFRSGGAGIAIWSRGVTVNFKVKNCTFRDLACGSSGAGILNYSSQNGQGNLVVENSKFLNSQAGFSGGAIINEGAFGGNVSAVIKNTVVKGNSGGGALRNTAYSDGEAILRCEGSVVSGNVTGSKGAGIFNSQDDPNDDFAEVSIINCTVTANNSFQGAGFTNEGGTAFVTNSIFWNNEASFAPGVYNNGGNTTIRHSMVQGETSFADGNIPTTNPNFIVDVSGTSAPTTQGDFRLQVCSPMADKGINDSLSLAFTQDLAGNPRIVNTTSAVQAVVDLGAYEFQGNNFQAFLDVNDDVSSTQIVGANVLEASSTVVDPANILYHGNNHVLLKPGFETQDNVVFQAKAGAFTCPE